MGRNKGIVRKSLNGGRTKREHNTEITEILSLRTYSLRTLRTYKTLRTQSLKAQNLRFVKDAQNVSHFSFFSSSSRHILEELRHCKGQKKKQTNKLDNNEQQRSKG